jgi:uncharacterized protein YukE
MTEQNRDATEFEEAAYKRGATMEDINDELVELCNATRAIAYAILPTNAAGQDAAGGTVGSLTEAVMGVTAGLVRIADALESVAEAVRERGTS